MDIIPAIVEAIVIAVLLVFLFVRLRKPKKKEPEKALNTESAGIIDMLVEAKTASFEMKSEDVAPESLTTIPYNGAEGTVLKLEDELPEEPFIEEEKKAIEKVPEEPVKEKDEKIPAREAEKVKPAKKRGRKKKPVKSDIKTSTDEISIPEKEEIKSEKEVPKKKTVRKKTSPKPETKAANEPETNALRDVIPIAEIEESKPDKEETTEKKPAEKELTEPTPEKKTVKEKSEKKPPKKKGREKLFT